MQRCIRESLNVILIIFHICDLEVRESVSRAATSRERDAQGAVRVRVVSGTEQVPHRRTEGTAQLCRIIIFFNRENVDVFYCLCCTYPNFRSRLSTEQ